MIIEGSTAIYHSEQHSIPKYNPLEENYLFLHGLLPFFKYRYNDTMTKNRAALLRLKLGVDWATSQLVLARLLELDFAGLARLVVQYLARPSRFFDGLI